MQSAKQTNRRSNSSDSSGTSVGHCKVAAGHIGGSVQDSARRAGGGDRALEAFRGNSLHIETHIGKLLAAELRRQAAVGPLVVCWEPTQAMPPRNRRTRAGMDQTIISIRPDK